jgi:hypothetical protein
MAHDDEYTRKYMQGSTARYVDKVKMPRWLSAALLGAGAIGAVAGVVSGGPLIAPIAVLATTVGVWALFSTIRVVVTDDVVHVQFGLFGPRIPVDKIVSVEVVDYNPLKYGGWGLRFGLDGSRAFSLPGHGGKAVRVRYKGRLGTRTVDVTSEHPEAVRAAIEEARHRDLSEVRAESGLAAASTDPIEAVHEERVGHDHEG